MSPPSWNSLSLPQRKARSKNVQTTAQLHLYHTLAKWCSKFSEPGFNSTWTMNFQIFKLDLEKAEEPEIKLSASIGSSKKQESSRKHLLMLYLLCQSLWLYGSQQTGKFWKRWEYQPILPTSSEICMRVKKQQLEPGMEQWTGSKLGKEYNKALYCHPENGNHGIWSHHFMGNRWRNSGNSVRLYFSGLPNHCRWWLQPWN